MGIHMGVAGARAIGVYLGGRLTAKGKAKVTLIGRKPLADATAQHGLTLREFEHGRPTEMDFLNEEIVRLAEEIRRARRR